MSFPTLRIPTGLGWLVWAHNLGMAFPEADEQALFDLAEEWKNAAENLRATRPRLERLVERMRAAYPSGAGGEAAIAALQDQLKHLPALAGQMDDLADNTRATATSIQYTKMQQIAFAVMTAYSIYELLAGGPEGAVGIPLVLASGRFAIRTLFEELLERLTIGGAGRALIEEAAEQTAKEITGKTLLQLGGKRLAELGMENVTRMAEKQAARKLTALLGKDVAGQAAEQTARALEGKAVVKAVAKTAVSQAVKEGAKGAILDASIQTIQLAAGDRDSFDAKQSIESAAGWAGGALVSVPVGAGMTRLFQRAGFTARAPRAAGMITGAVAGSASAVGMWAGGLAVPAIGQLVGHGTIDANFDPKMAVGMGLLGAGHGGVRPKVATAAPRPDSDGTATWQPSSEALAASDVGAAGKGIDSGASRPHGAADGPARSGGASRSGTADRAVNRDAPKPADHSQPPESSARAGANPAADGAAKAVVSAETKTQARGPHGAADPVAPTSNEPPTDNVTHTVDARTSVPGDTAAHIRAGASAAPADGAVADRTVEMDSHEAALRTRLQQHAADENPRVRQAHDDVERAQAELDDRQAELGAATARRDELKSGLPERVSAEDEVVAQVPSSAEQVKATQDARPAEVQTLWARGDSGLRDPKHAMPTADRERQPLSDDSRLEDKQSLLRKPSPSAADEYRSTPRTRISEHQAALDDVVARAHSAMAEARERLVTAEAVHEAVLREVVHEHYAELKAESDAGIAAAEQEALRVRRSTEARMKAARKNLLAAKRGVEDARIAHEKAETELDVVRNHGLDDSVEAVGHKVATARDALRDSRSTYERARSDSEPRREHMAQLRREIERREADLRAAMVEHEALLRAAGRDGDSTGAQVERRDVVWRRRRAFKQAVARRAREWQAVLDSDVTDATEKAQDMRVHLESRELTCRAALKKFEQETLSVIEDRLAELEKAKTPDRVAYEAGLADKRAALAAASRKALAAGDAVVKAAFVFRDEVLRHPSDTAALVAPVSDEVVDHLVRNGTRAERVAAMAEWMTRRDPAGRTPRETQMLAYVLTEFGPADMKGGEGKTLVMVMSGYRDALVNGVAHTVTSSEPLVVDMVGEVLSYLGDQHPDAGVDVVQLRENEPFAQSARTARAEGRNLFVVGTKEGFLFAGVHEAEAMTNEIAQAGAPKAVVDELRGWIGTEPPLDELADRLDAVAAEYGSARRYEPVPEGVVDFDEVDTVFDGEVRVILSPGARENADPSTVTHLKEIYDRFRIAILDHGLTAADFGRPNETRGLWHARIDSAALDKLARTTGNPQSVLADAQHYSRFALARWGLECNTDHYVSREHDRVMLINSKTNDKLSWDRDTSTETRLRELGPYLDVVAGVTVRGDHPEDSLTMSLRQWIGSRFFKSPRGISGTAKEVEEPVYHQWGGLEDQQGDYFGVPEIERYYRSKLILEDAQDYHGRHAKLEGMAADIVETAEISFVVDAGRIVGIEQKGRPQWNIHLDNGEIRGTDERVVERVVDASDGRRTIEENRIALTRWQDKERSERGIVDWVDAIVQQRLEDYAAAHGLQIADGVKMKYTVLDARWYEEHGGGAIAEREAAGLIADFGDLGDCMFGNKSIARGSDPSPSPAAIEKDGLFTRVSGGPAYSRRVVLQAVWRSARGGSGEDRDNGGTPGAAKEYRCPEDYLSEIADAQATREITHFTDAVAGRNKAAADIERTPSDAAHRALAAAEREVERAARVLQEETAPRLQNLAEQRLLAPHRDLAANPAHAPPVSGSDALARAALPAKSSAAQSPAERMVADPALSTPSPAEPAVAPEHPWQADDVMGEGPRDSAAESAADGSADGSRTGDTTTPQEHTAEIPTSDQLAVNSLADSERFVWGRGRIDDSTVGGNWPDEFSQLPAGYLTFDSGVEAFEYGRGVWGGTTRSIPDDQVEDFLNPYLRDSAEINSSLRSGVIGADQARRIRGLDHLLGMTPTPRKVRVGRDVDPYAHTPPLWERREGEVIHEPGFMSTSLGPLREWGVNVPSDGQIDIRLHLDVPEGTHALFTGHVDVSANELILRRGLNYRILRIEKSEISKTVGAFDVTYTRYDIHAEIIGSDFRDPPRLENAEGSGGRDGTLFSTRAGESEQIIAPGGPGARSAVGTSPPEFGDVNDQAVSPDSGDHPARASDGVVVETLDDPSHYGSSPVHLAAVIESQHNARPSDDVDGAVEYASPAESSGPSVPTDQAVGGGAVGHAVTVGGSHPEDLNVAPPWEVWRDHAGRQPLRHLGGYLPGIFPPADDRDVHVARAVEKLGLGARIEDLLHGDHVTDVAGHARQRATANALWWDSLTARERISVVEAHPGVIGNVDGIPVLVRDYANRLAIARDLTGYRNRRLQETETTWRTTLTGGERRHFGNVVTTRNHLVQIERDAAELPGQPPVFLMSYDAAAFGGKGRAVVAIGDVDTAHQISWHVGGFRTTLRSLSYRWHVARNQYLVTSRIVPPEDMVSIVWIGYEHPTQSPGRLRGPAADPVGPLRVAGTRYAQVGGRLLLRDIAAFNATRRHGGHVDNHVFGHSYGSVVMSYAAARDRSNDIADLTFIGSPGAGEVHHVDRYGGKKVYVVTNSRDPVTFLGADRPGSNGRIAGLGLGIDPAAESFGATRVRAESPDAPAFAGIEAHESYYKFADDQDIHSTESLDNIGRIAGGRGDTVTVEQHRRGIDQPTIVQRIGTRPDDPARHRPTSEITEPRLDSTSRKDDHNVCVSAVARDRAAVFDRDDIDVVTNVEGRGAPVETVEGDGQYQSFVSIVELYERFRSWIESLEHRTPGRGDDMSVQVVEAPTGDGNVGHTYWLRCVSKDGPIRIELRDPGRGIKVSDYRPPQDSDGLPRVWALFAGDHGREAMVLDSDYSTPRLDPRPHGFLVGESGGRQPHPGGFEVPEGSGGAGQDDGVRQREPGPGAHPGSGERVGGSSEELAILPSSVARIRARLVDAALEHRAPGGESDCDAQVLAAVPAWALQRAAAGLTDSQREVVQLRGDRFLTVEHTAAELGVPPAEVRFLERKIFGEYGQLVLRALATGSTEVAEVGRIGRENVGAVDFRDIFDSLRSDWGEFDLRWWQRNKAEEFGRARGRLQLLQQRALDRMMAESEGPKALGRTMGAKSADGQEVDPLRVRTRWRMVELLIGEAQNAAAVLAGTIGRLAPGTMMQWIADLPDDERGWAERRFVLQKTVNAAAGRLGLKASGMASPAARLERDVLRKLARPLAAALRSCYPRLNPDERLFVDLRYRRGPPLSMSEIAKKLPTGHDSDVRDVMYRVLRTTAERAAVYSRQAELWFDPGLAVAQELVAILPGRADTGANCRAAVQRSMSDWSSVDEVDTAVLVTAEVVGNVARHAGSYGLLSVTVIDDGRRTLRVEVSDASPALPARREAGADAESGRGMGILEMMASRSGLQTHSTGRWRKTIWFEIDEAGGGLEDQGLTAAAGPNELSLDKPEQIVDSLSITGLGESVDRAEGVHPGVAEATSGLDPVMRTRLEVARTRLAALRRRAPVERDMNAALADMRTVLIASDSGQGGS